MGRKFDIAQVDRIALEFGMDRLTRHEFGEYLEQCKRYGDRGSANERGDFTYAELRRKADEFLAEDL